jgi:hypothetical protein
MKTRLLLAAFLLLICTSLACRQDLDPPCVITQQAYYETSEGAELHGWLDSLGESSRVEVYFLVAASPTDLKDETPRQTLMEPGAFSYTVKNLDSNHTYWFWAVAKGENAEDPDVGDALPFTTLPEVTLPIVTTGNYENVTSESATLHGEVVSMGMASELYVSIELGTTSGGPYNLMFTGPGTFQSPGPFIVDASGLTPETTYYYRAAGTSVSTVVTPGEEKSFTTTKGAELTILSHQEETDHATYYTVAGQAKNTGTKPLTYALISVDFKDASGAVLAAANVDKSGLALEEVWTWEATYPLSNISDVASYQAQVAQILTT